MANIPYVLSLQQALAASGTGTMLYPVPQNQDLKLFAWYTLKTGNYRITAIRDSAGQFYTNASSTNPIDGQLIQNVNSPNIGNNTLAEPIHVPGGRILYIDLLDYSAAPNTINLWFLGTLEVPSGG